MRTIWVNVKKIKEMQKLKEEHDIPSMDLVIGFMLGNLKKRIKYKGPHKLRRNKLTNVRRFKQV